MRFLTLFLLLLGFLNGCGSLSSGHYVQLRKGESIKELSKTFRVPAWKIKQYNPDKYFRTGEWVFIPLKRGLMRNSKSINPSVPLKEGVFSWPVPSSKRVSSQFGHRWGRPHEGIDIPARNGASIVAADDGIVIYSGKELGGYGNITVISHENGLFTVYAHAKKNFTQKGQRVYRKQVIAQVGTTGRSTGPHLHFEVRYESKALNPMPYLAKN
jgi:murein DD-endopeptidase MepM/ murein hydrolase activator NlpD